MSHEIRKFDIQQGRAMAWHGLTQVKEDLNLANCWLREWDIQSEKLFIEAETDAPLADEGGTPRLQKVDTGFRILRATDKDENGNPIMIGGGYDPESFKPITNSAFLDMIAESIKNETGIELVSCGSVMNRGRIFASLSLPEKFQAAGRPFEAFLNFGQGHDRSSVLWGNTSNICTVCNNTFTANLMEQGKTMSLRVKHTRFSEMKLENGIRYIKGALEAQTLFVKKMDKLALSKVSEDTARELFAGFINGDMSAMSTRAANIVETLVQLFKTGKGNNGENLADAFSAVTDYFTHDSAGDDKMKQFVSSEFGAGAEKKQLFWDILTGKDCDKKTEGLILIGRAAIAETVKSAQTPS